MDTSYKEHFTELKAFSIAEILRLVIDTYVHILNV